MNNYNDDNKWDEPNKGWPYIPNKEWDKKYCRHPEHNIPGMRVYPPGTHTHTCPGCGETTTFVVHGYTCCC